MAECHFLVRVKIMFKKYNVMSFRNLASFLFASVLGGIIAVFVYVQVVKSDRENFFHEVATSDPNHHLASYSTANIRDVSYPDLTFAAEKAVHCVVHVKVKSMVDTYANFWDYIYGRRQQVPQEAFVGSGVIVSADGYIVTNNHVINRSDEIEVALNDRRMYTAKLIGTDPETDLALLKIDETDLPFLIFGDSEALRVGEWVLAVGNPFNLTSTVTAGIVSAKARHLGFTESRSKISIESFIQTDAAVNPGNSGGALVNTLGELIGINSVIYTRTGDFSGYSFAIPTSIVQKVIGDLKEFGLVQRALLDVDFKGVDDKSTKENEELTIVNVTENGGAAASGIKVGDVVTAINNVNVNSFAEFQEQISKYRPNDQVNITVIRDKKTQHFVVTLRNIEGTTQILRRDASGYHLGAIFEGISQKEKNDLGIKSGVRVKEIAQDSQLRSVGIRNGFIIFAVNDKPVNSASDIQRIVDTIENRGRILFNCINTKGEVSYYVFVKQENRK